MKKIQSYFVMLLLMLAAVSAQAQKHRLTVVSTVGRSLSINIYNHHSDGSWDFYNNLTNNTADYSVSCELAAGDSVKIEVMGMANLGWVYTHMEFEGKKMFEGREVMVSSDVWPVFTMPSHDVTINACAEFDPEVPEGGWEYGDGQMQNPESPGTNSWNATTGELFVNYFQKAGQAPGGNSIGGFHLYAYLNQFGIKPADVKTLTVSGEVGMSSECFSVLGSYNALPNAEKLDLRHTFGHTSYQGVWDDGVNKHEDVLEIHVDGMPKLKQLILPSNIKYMGWWQLPPNSVLEAVTLYATVPPAICISEYEYTGYMLYGFDRIPQSCVLYVPEQSVAAYKADKVWGTRFADVLAIPEGEAENITVDLPDNFMDGRYKGMSLVLFNARSGEQTKYIVDERPSYIFYAQTNEEPYTAHLMSPQGVLVASTDTVTLSNQPMEMTFKSVQPMQAVQLTVQTPAGEEGGTPTDVTDQTTIVWMDAMGNRIGTGSTLDRQVEGTRLLYGITLPTELAARYGAPPRTELVVKEATAQTIYTLSQPDTLTLSGRVTDPDGNPIGIATVTASLMMNGTVGKVFTATTDQLGRYELETPAGDLTLSATARGYVAARKAVEYSRLSDPNSNFDLTLSPLAGPTIHYDFTYTASVAADEEGQTLPYYSDYQNVTIAAYNETTGEALDSLMVQYPEVQLLSGAKAGDRIRLTASSLKDLFMPVEVSVTLNNDEEKADSVTFALKELGGVEVSFLRSDNQAVTATLYDADGLLCRQETFTEATLTLTGLKDGDYTVVTMGSDPFLSKMLYLSDYTAVGMEADKDYLSNKVKVESGLIAEVTNDQIPTLYAEPFYYTDDTKTLFLPNKTEVSTSCNVTLRAEIGFKESIRDRVSNVRLLVDYPADKAEYVEGSSMTGTKMVRVTVEDGRLTIPVEKDYLDEPTRFILTAIDQGTLMASAQVQFTLDGREVTQPIGFATCDVKYMTIVAPESIYKLSFPVYGTAPALSPVRVYAGNDILVGETHSLADGSWNMHVELPGCPNLATIPVYAVITTKQGREAKTETVNVTYNKDMIRPLHVLMFPPLIGKWNNPKDYSSVISDANKLCIDFDYENPMSLSEQWYSAYVHTSNPFLFEIIFNTTDSTKVKNVTIIYQTVNGEIGYLPTEYDGITGHWMCSVNLKNDAVCSVDVDYEDASEKHFDNNLQFVASNFLEYQREGFEELQNTIDSLMTEIAGEKNPDRRWTLMKEYAELIGVDMSGIEDEPVPDITLDEAFAQIENDLADLDFNLSEVLTGMNIQDADFGDGLSITSAEGLTAERLLSEGYSELTGIDGSTLYELVGNDSYRLVDLKNNIYMEVRGKAFALMAPARRKIKGDFITDVNRYVGEIMTQYNELQAIVALSKVFAGDAVKFFGNLTSSLSRDISYLMKVWHEPGMPPLTDKQLKTLADLGGKKGFLQSVKESAVMLQQDGLDPSKLKHFVTPKTFLGKLMQSSLKTMQAIGEVFSYVAILNDIKEGADRVNQLMSIWEDVPDPCEEQQADATALKKDIEEFAYYEMNYFKCLAVADLLATGLVKTGLKALPGTVGTSITEVFSGIGATLVKLAANYLNDETYASKLQHYSGEIYLLDCDEESRKWNEKRRRALLKVENREHLPKVRVGIDPSGYVYEAVADNRVENATATIYYKQTGEDEYGDLHDEVVKWRAEEFRQENPLLTDAEGKYAWDVPQGLWQVKIEKAGYETAYSDWLPVPPPQLDINIPLVRNTLPAVQAARAYEDGVEVTFNEYMRPQSLTAERLTLTQDGQLLPCRIEEQNRSLSYDKKDAYVSRVKVRTESPLASGSKVQLTVRRQVEAYNGLQMQKDYQQEFTVVREVYAIGTDSIVEVPRGGERTVVVHAFPAQAAAGMKVTAKSVIGTIAMVTEEAIFDANGEARLTVTGKVGGQTALLLTLENSKVAAQSVIIVEDASLLPVYTPTASLISGVSVRDGETVALSCDTEDAIIWYTTDGSCPCDENGTRVKYTEPIVITQPVTIRAYAVKGDAVSRVASFSYGIFDPSGIHSPTVGDESDPWYSVRGVRLNKKPARKGVYISGRRKVAVR